MSDASFIRALREFIREHSLVARDDRIIAAVSGGIDSIVLLDVLGRLRQEWNLELAVAHFNHQLRGKESEGDEAFVHEAADRLGIQFHADRADTHAYAESMKLSIQEAARDLRYDFFRRLRTSLGFQRIAVGHNGDDNAETVLFNMLRGAGVHGLTGIPVTRKDMALVRPLLFATREEIQRYAAERHLEHREDSSNKKIDYSRNFLRHQIIPQLQERINPNLMGTLRRCAELSHQLEDYLHVEASHFLSRVIVETAEREIVLSLTTLRSEPLFLQEYILHKTAKDFAHGEIEFSTVREMLKVAEAETGSSCSVARDVVFCRDRDRLVLRRQANEPLFRHAVNPNQAYEFSGFHFTSSFVEKANFTDNPNIEYIDAGRLAGDLVLRTWNNGDWLVPLGMQQKKKVSDLFIEQKVPVYEKHTIPILESGGSIVWICGKRLDDRWKVMPTTKQILKLQYEPNNPGR